MISDDIIESIVISEEAEPDETTALFPADTGELSLETRRAIVQLLTGPFISGSKHSRLWSILLRDEKIIQSRLSELFLTLVIDRDQRVAFTKKAEAPGIDMPSLLRRSQLTFIDSALILHLRRQLAQADASNERAVISTSDILEHLSMYEKESNTDKSGHMKRVKASIEKLKKSSILHLIRNTKDRFEISPTLKLLFSAAEIAALTLLYKKIIAGEETSVLVTDNDSAMDIFAEDGEDHD